MSSTEEKEWMLPRRRRDLDVFGPPGLPGAGPLDVPMKTTSLSLEVHSSNITLNSSCRTTPGCSTVCTVFRAIFHTFQTTSGFPILFPVQNLSLQMKCTLLLSYEV